MLAMVGAALVVMAVAGQDVVPEPPPSAAGATPRTAPDRATSQSAAVETSPTRSEPARTSRPKSTPPTPDIATTITEDATSTAPSTAPGAVDAETRAPATPASSAAGLFSLAPVAAPTSVTIPTISAHSELIDLGKNSDGTLEVPDDYRTAGWYTGAVPPGQIGSAVIVGHVDSYRGPGIFFRLGDLRPGDEVQVARADHTTAVFTVDGVQKYPKDDFPTAAVYADVPYPGLRLITCGGDFDRTSLNYLSNIVVFATLTDIIATP